MATFIRFIAQVLIVLGVFCATVVALGLVISASFYILKFVLSLTGVLP
jgi:hypothetical protein